uniref:Methyl-accepting chemotaxis sensory transducer n=1 Tax=Geobacter sp. (strain M21) TaxID=443144 RepID=C6DZZ7_GEOSM
MKWYCALPLGRKILAGFLLVAAVSGLSGILAAGSIYDVAARAERMYAGNLVPISGLPEVVREYQTSLCLLRDVVIDRSDQERLEHRELLRQSGGKVEKGLAAIFASNRSPQAAALQKSITEDLKLFGFFRDKIVDLAAQGRQDEAVNIMRNQGGDVIARVDKGIGEIVALNKAQAGKRHAENTQAARLALALSAACLSLGVAAALAIGYFLSRSITAPLSAVAGKVAEIAAGDLTVRLDATPATAGSRNQLHVLSRHVDKMAQTLHSVVSCIVSESGKLSAASGVLNNRSIGLAAGAESAREQMEMVALSSAEIDGAASEIARNCSVAADNVTQANRAVESACRIMGETIETMQVVGEQSRETSAALSQLGERSLQIGEIAGTINDIADQTNLLALNAAIEAARAGEQGRGFAVVANEVRALATRTTTATSEIEQMIRSIQAETRLAMNAMERGVAEAEQGVVKAHCTGEALAAVTATIEAIALEVSHIATAAEEQSLSVHAMTGNIGRVTGVIRESGGGAHDFAGAAARMHLVAEELQSLVGRFTISQPDRAASYG